jgi:hypothetical protein
MLIKFEDLDLYEKAITHEVAFTKGMAAAMMCLCTDFQANTTDDMSDSEALDVLDGIIEQYKAEIATRLGFVLGKEGWIERQVK